MATGGLTKGKSHAEGGIPMTVKDTGQNIEVEGGEIIINKKSVADPQKHSFDGEKLTKCEIASKINEADGNGVKIDCDSVEGKKYKFEQGGKTEELSEIFDDYYKKGGNIIELKNGLGYDKSILPQIRSGKKRDFSKYLNDKYDRKMTYNVMVVASTLKPVQSQINLGQLQAIQKGGFKSGKPITISNDGYVIDGHHRWYYANQNNMSLPALKIDLPAKAVIRESFESGLAEVDDINTIRNKKEDGGIVSKQYKNKPIPLTLYKSFFIDTDSDGIPNVDDVAPFSAEINLNLEEVSLSDEMRTIIDYRNDYEKVRKEVVEDLKEIINECDVKQQCGIYSRTKTPYSIVNKLRRRSLTDTKDLDKLEQKAKSKLKDKDLTGIDLYKGLTDVVGTMVVTPNKKNADKIKDSINKGKLGKVLEFEDFYENPNNGYRAYHFLIAVQKDGKTFPVEVQVKTERVKKLAGLSHTVYKRGNLNAKGFNKLNELALKSDKGDRQAQKKFDEILKDSKQLSKLIEKKPTRTILDKNIKFDIGGSLEYDYYTKYEDDAQKFIDEAYFLDYNLFDENKSEELEKLFEDSIDKSFELRKKYQLQKLEENNMTADNEKRKKAKALLNKYKVKMADGGQATDRYTQMKKDFNISYFDRHASMSGDTRDKLLFVGQYPSFVLYEDNRLDIPYSEDEAKKIKMQLKKAGFDDATFKNQMAGLYDGFDYTENDRFKKNFEIIEELDPKFFQVLNPIIKEVKAYPRTEYPNRGLFDKGGLVVRGYGEIPYMDIEDISASYQDEDGEYQIDKIDIVDIDGGTSDEIFEQVKDLVGEDVETVEFVKTDGDFFDVYDMNDEFDVEQWNKRYQFDKGGRTEDNTFANVLKKYGFEEKTGNNNIRKFVNNENNITATVDTKGRLVEVFDNDKVKKGEIAYSGYSLSELKKFLSQNKFAKGGILENMFEGYDSMYQYALANNFTPRQLAEELKFMTNLENKGDKDLYDFLNSLTDMFPDTPISEFTKGGGKMAKGGMLSESEKRTFIKHAQNYLKDFYDDEESANFRIKQDYLPNLKKLDDKRYQVEYNGSAGTLIKQEFTLSNNSLKDIRTFEKNLMDKNPKWEKFVYAKGGKVESGDKVILTTDSLGKKYKGMMGEITSRKLLNDLYSVKLENGLTVSLKKGDFRHNSINPKYAKGGEVKELRDISNALKKGSKLHAKQSEQLMGASKSHIKQSEELDKIADELTEMQKLVKTYEQGGLITGNPIEKLIPYYQLQALKEGEQEIKSGLRDEPLFLDDLNNAYKLVPPEYEPIGTGMNKVAFFHYFYGGSDWYITELDKKSNYAMGYVILNGDTQMSEYGSININELTDKSIGNILSNVNIDQYFKPQTLNQIFQSKYPELVQGEIEIYEDKKEVDVVETTDYLNMDFKNPYERNLVIRKLIDEKGDIGNNYSVDEKEFIQLYSGMGGLEKFGATEGLLYEYYTPKDIVQKMWGLAFKHKLGTQKIEVCVEPSVATGNFVGYAPENVKMIGYDIDKYAYSICNAIYGNEKHEFYNVSFEKLFINNRNQSVKDKIEPFCDLVIGNPPYGKYSGLYAGMGEKKYTGAEDFIDYFIFRSLDILKSGGLLVFIIGKLTQLGGQRFTDKIAKNPNRCQLEIRQKSNLVDAYRLPVGVFDTTQVESEIIVLRKK